MVDFLIYPLVMLMIGPTHFGPGGSGMEHRGSYRTVRAGCNFLRFHVLRVKKLSLGLNKPNERGGTSTC